MKHFYATVIFPLMDFLTSFQIYNVNMFVVFLHELSVLISSWLFVCGSTY